jgi:hypothetical protein
MSKLCDTAVTIFCKFEILDCSSQNMYIFFDPTVCFAIVFLAVNFFCYFARLLIQDFSTTCLLQTLFFSVSNAKASFLIVLCNYCCGT